MSSDSVIRADVPDPAAAHTRRGRLGDTLLGDVHEPVVSRASVPVVLVPAGARLGDSKRLVLACRRSDPPRNAAELAGRLAARLRASVLVAQVLPPHGSERPSAWQVYDAARRDSHAVAAASGEQIVVEYAEYDGDVDQMLARVPEHVNAAFMVIGERRRTSLQRLLRPSVASGVARRARHPIIVVPDAADGLEPRTRDTRLNDRSAHRPR